MFGSATAAQVASALTLMTLIALIRPLIGMKAMEGCGAIWIVVGGMAAARGEMVRVFGCDIAKEAYSYSKRGRLI